MKRALQQLRLAFSIALPVVIAAASVVMGVTVIKDHIRVVRILTGSMEPLLSPGDLAIVKPIPLREVATGMVIVGVNAKTQSTYAHRVLTTDFVNGAWEIETMGDANALPDPVLKVDSVQIPKLIARIPVGIVGEKIPPLRSGFGIGIAGLLLMTFFWEIYMRRSRRTS